MKVTAPADLYVPALVDDECGGQVVKGQSYEVPDDVGGSLVEQGWKSPTTKKKDD